MARTRKHPAGGRLLKFKDLDTQLAAWVRERRSKTLKISRRTIQMKAQQMVSAEEDVVDLSLLNIVVEH
uniref:HTH CENPB-type domain-containing protein n=1 Tax=Ditylenchus dipsaci TaxID=166011 RepID=A0A915DXI3_9BILA